MSGRSEAVSLRGMKRSERNQAIVEAKTFGSVLRDALLEREIVTGIGNPNWSAFADQLEGVHYETLRKAVAGERAPGPGLMEAVAAGLGESPEIFFEYRLQKAQADFDPKQVGVDQALANLEAWVAARSK